MRRFLRVSGFLLLLGCLVVVSVLLVQILFSAGNVAATKQRAYFIKPTPTLPSTTTTRLHPQKPCPPNQRHFQLGVAFPQWSPSAYGGNDAKWLAELPAMRKQTAACWVEMPILFTQTSLSSTVVMPGVNTPSLSAFTYGIKYAHMLGLHVFVSSLLQVQGPQPWSGAINFSSPALEQQWFDGYWQALKPYATVAAQEKVEQLSLGTEEEWLQINAPNALWNNLIANAHDVFPGSLTYDVNWTSVQKPIPIWMHNPHLKMIGVSAYFPLADTPAPVDATKVPQLWSTMIKSQLDTFAQELGKPIFLSEIGYRHNSDALYQPWVSLSSAPLNPQVQAIACDAALKNILNDKYIFGSFFWGWDDVDAFTLKNSQAAAVIHSHYSALQAGVER